MTIKVAELHHNVQTTKTDFNISTGPSKCAFIEKDVYFKFYVSVTITYSSHMLYHSSVHAQWMSSEIMLNVFIY